MGQAQKTREHVSGSQQPRLERRGSRHAWWPAPCLHGSLQGHGGLLSTVPASAPFQAEAAGMHSTAGHCRQQQNLGLGRGQGSWGQFLPLPLRSLWRKHKGCPKGCGSLSSTVNAPSPPTESLLSVSRERATLARAQSKEDKRLLGATRPWAPRPAEPFSSAGSKLMLVETYFPWQGSGAILGRNVEAQRATGPVPQAQLGRGGSPPGRSPAPPGSPPPLGPSFHPS